MINRILRGVVMSEANDLMRLLDGLCDLPCGWDIEINIEAV